MTVKTNNVQKGGGWFNKSLTERVKEIRNDYPCFPKISDVTPMDGKRPEKIGDDLENDIQIGINYARCQRCEDRNCNSCSISDVNCHYDNICGYDKYATRYDREFDKYKCFLKNKNLSFDDYYLANYFKKYSTINDYPKTRYIIKSDYDKFRKAVSWKFTMLPKFYSYFFEDVPKDYLSWGDLCEYIENPDRFYGGKKSRKSRNKKRKSNKKKRKTVKKRRLRKQK